MINSKDEEIAKLKLELNEKIGLVRTKNQEIQKFENESELQNVEISDLKKVVEEKINFVSVKNEENEKLLKKNTKLRQLLEEGDQELKQLKVDNGIFIEKNKRLRRSFKITGVLRRTLQRTHQNVASGEKSVTTAIEKTRH